LALQRRDGTRHVERQVDTESSTEDGEVVRGPYAFYHGTDAIEFKLTSSGRIVRYGEIKSAAPGVHVGTKLKEGDLIAFVGYREQRKRE